MRFVASEELEIGSIVGRDIIFTAQAAMLRQGTPLTPRYISFLREKGFLGAYVADELSKSVELTEPVKPKTFQAGVEAVKENNVSALVDVAKDIVKDIVSKDSVCMDLLDLRSYDDYTYHHCVNVSVCSVLIGRQMALDNKELVNLCQVGLLHDLGKSRIKLDILNKPGKLSDEEFSTMKSHAMESYNILANNFEVPGVVKQAVLMHHENENGSGYPLGKTGDELSIYAKIVHAADVYDALTSKRPYKEPFEPIKAFDYLVGGKGILFDEDVVDALTAIIPPFPKGIEVYLSNGERALVIDHSKNNLRPIVKFISNGNVVDLATDPGYIGIEIERCGILPLKSFSGNVSSLNEGRLGSAKERRKRVLIVDDTPLTRLQIAAALEYEYDVEAKTGAIEALNFVKESKKPMDVLIINADLPIMDGITTVEKIRKTWPDIPVIFLAGANDTDTIVHCQMIKNSDYVVKPVNPIYIHERVYASIHNGRV